MHDVAQLASTMWSTVLLSPAHNQLRRQMVVHPILGEGRGMAIGAMAVEPSVALKLSCNQSHQGELQVRVHDAATTPSGLRHVERAPWWLTESLVDDAIYSSHRALSWLADGKPVSVVRQVELGNKEIGVRIPDYILVSDRIRFVELEKDGRKLASEQLKEQLRVCRDGGKLSPEERVELLAVDTRETPRPELPDNADWIKPKFWHLAHDPSEPMARWVVLSQNPEVGYSPKAERPNWQPRLVDGFDKMAVSVLDGEAMLRDSVCQAAVVKIAFHTAKEHRADKTRFYAAGYMMAHAPKWLAQLAKYLWDRDDRRLCQGWRIFDSTGRGNSANVTSLLLYYRDGTDARVALEPALRAFPSENVDLWTMQARISSEQEKLEKNATRRRW